MSKARPARKATFVIREEVLNQARDLVDQGAARSLNAFVEDALAAHVREARRKALAKAMAEASRDPRFIRDLEETMRDFAPLDAETIEADRS